jgi:hypothetical protein
LIILHCFVTVGTVLLAVPRERACWLTHACVGDRPTFFLWWRLLHLRHGPTCRQAWTACPDRLAGVSRKVTSVAHVQPFTFRTWTIGFRVACVCPPCSRRSDYGQDKREWHRFVVFWCGDSFWNTWKPFTAVVSTKRYDEEQP